ncbi:response regulator transcription factor, partial [Streptomyces sp. NPDC059477]|uniref:helix-turn-helix transcriptional regulator n=1 Tax=Streptomyces sp. NPDC059477 TaxID=3346847 RepID=UPI00369429FC
GRGGGGLRPPGGPRPPPCGAAHPEISAVLPSPWVEEQRALILACARLAGGRGEEAGEVVAEAVGELVGGDPGEYGSALGAVEAARVLLAAGRAEDAAGLVRRVRGDRHAGPAVTVRASLVRARLALAAGDTPGARRLVGQALLDGRRERLRRPFLDARDWIGPLLTTPPLAELAASWLPYGPPVAVAGTAPLVGELSAREREVLRGLAAMMSTQDIAADLCVSVNTVKTHLKGVYRKLAVNRRNDAVRRARELGLL